MKKRKRLVRFAICAALACGVIFVAGCTENDRHGNTIDEPEITVDYLSGEYAQQLLRDEAEYVFGSIDLVEQTDGSVIVKITAKQYVEDGSQPNGYYIADRNMEYNYPLSSQARATFLSGGTSIAKAFTIDEFIGATARDLEEYGAANPEYSNNKLYDIYVMNDQVELLIARYLP